MSRHLAGAAAALVVGVTLAAIGAEPASPARTAYTNGFDGNIGEEWSHRITAVTQRGRRRYLGPFGGEDPVRLTLTKLPPHERLRIRVGLFILRTWDGKDSGSPGVGPDIWSLAVEGRCTLLRSSFDNPGDGSGDQQTFPGPFPGPFCAPQTGAAEKDTLGEHARDRYKGNAVYRLDFTFSHCDPNVTFVFAAGRLEGVDNEAWGIDEVQVEALPAAGPIDADRVEALRSALDADPIPAFQAYRELMAAGRAGAALLAESLRPRPLDEATVRRLIADLDAERYSVREKATAALRKAGPGAAPLLRAALKDKASVEAATRINAILADLTAKDPSPGRMATFVRTIRLLEIAACKEGVAGLAHLRNGGPTPKLRHLAGVAAVRSAGPMIDALLRQADAEASKLDFPAAGRACRRAIELAKLTASPAEGDAAAKLARLDGLLAVHKEFQRRAANLDPADRKGRDWLLRTALTELDSPALAAKDLDSQGPDAMRRNVLLAARQSSQLADADLPALAKWYRGLAGEAGAVGRPAMLRRARRYYGLYAQRLRATVADIERTAEGIADELASAAPGPWIDPARHLCIDLHRVSGAWAVSGDGIAVSPGKFARLALPVAPRGDYELTADFVRKTGSADVIFVLPVAPTGVLFVLDDGEGNAGFQNVNGQDLFKADPPHNLTNGRTYRFHATVRRRRNQAEVRIRLDGKDYLDWHGPLRSLSVRGSWHVSDKGALGLGAHDSAVVFSKLRLHMLSGRAELLRPSIDPPPKPQRIEPPGVLLQNEANIRIRNRAADPRERTTTVRR